MRSILLFIVATFAMYYSYAQNTLEVIDTGNITRERWRDSMLRMERTRYQQVFMNIRCLDLKVINTMA